MSALPDGLGPASFRGELFDARDIGYATGRRIDVAEHPQHDEPSSEDLGRAVRRWRLQAFLVEDEPKAVQARKLAIIDACERPGPGNLVHPKYGTLRVRCESLEVSESADATNVVELSMGFVEAGAVLPAVKAPKTQARTFGDDLRETIREFYAARLQVRGVSRKVVRALGGTIEDRAAAMLELAGVLSGDDTSDYVHAVRVIADTYSTGVADGAELADGVQAAIKHVHSPRDLRTIAHALGAVFEASATAYAAGATARDDRAILTNRYLTDLMLYGSALASTAEAAALDTYRAYDDALAVQTDVADRLAALELHAEGRAYAALVDLRRALVDAIQRDTLDLPRLRDLDVTRPQCALTLAHRLYGDAARASELVERNGVADPNAVSGALRVLTT